MADLIDKVVATENDMALLKQQLERERAKRQQLAATGAQRAPAGGSNLKGTLAPPRRLGWPVVRGYCSVLCRLTAPAS